MAEFRVPWFTETIGIFDSTGEAILATELAALRAARMSALNLATHRRAVDRGTPHCLASAKIFFCLGLACSADLAWSQVNGLNGTTSAVNLSSTVAIGRPPSI